MMKDSWKKIPGLLEEWVKIKKKIRPSEVMPSKDKIFKVFSFFEVHETRAVILAGLPYKLTRNKKDINTGLAFAVESIEDDTSILEVIRDAMALDLHEIAIEDYFDYTLEHWAKQGVLLLNVALTRDIVERNRTTGVQPEILLWENFIGLVLKEINKLGIPCVLASEASGFYKEDLTNCEVLHVPHPLVQVELYEPDKEDNFDNKGVFNFLNKHLKRDIEWLIY